MCRVEPIAQIEPLTTARALRGPFDYRLPPEFEGGAVGVGSMLVVPFGRREVLGVVTGLSERSEIAEEKLLEPLRALELGRTRRPRGAGGVARGGVLLDGGARAAAGAARRGDRQGPAGLGVRKRRARAVARPRHEPIGVLHAEPPPLTDDQRQALDAIEQR